MIRTGRVLARLPLLFVGFLIAALVVPFAVPHALGSTSAWPEDTISVPATLEGGTFTAASASTQVGSGSGSGAAPTGGDEISLNPTPPTDLPPTSTPDVIDSFSRGAGVLASAADKIDIFPASLSGGVGQGSKETVVFDLATFSLQLKLNEEGNAVFGSLRSILSEQGLPIPQNMPKYTSPDLPLGFYLSASGQLKVDESFFMSSLYSNETRVDTFRFTVFLGSGVSQIDQKLSDEYGISRLAVKEFTIRFEERYPPVKEPEGGATDPEQGVGGDETEDVGPLVPRGGGYSMVPVSSDSTPVAVPAEKPPLAAQLTDVGVASPIAYMVSFVAIDLPAMIVDSHMATIIAAGCFIVMFASLLRKHIAQRITFKHKKDW